MPAALAILTVSGVFDCYQVAANATFVQATPSAQRSQAFGIVQGGMSLGQGTAMILAGAAAERFAPSLVIATAGAIGAVAAIVVALTRRERQADWRVRLLRDQVADPGQPGVAGSGFSPRWVDAGAPSWVAGVWRWSGFSPR